MAEYIDRQQVIDALWKLRRQYQLLDDTQTADKIMQGLYSAEQAVNDVPSADVEPVVRCKYCHFFEQDHWETVNGVPLIVAHNICTRWGRGCQTAEDGFCFMAIRSQGARMDGANYE